jgi:signal peptidase I
VADTHGKAATAGTGGGKKAGKKHKGRELIECLLVAAALALSIRTFGFQIFKIPTRSMEPALYGNENYGDRVVAMMWYNRGRLGLGLGGVHRWQVLVFRHEVGGEPTNYIKRVVGLPGERLEIRDGDIWVAGPRETRMRIARKPRDLQEDIWIRLCQMDFEDPRRLPYYWDAQAGSSVRVEDGELLFGSSPGSESLLHWRHRRGIDNRFIRLTVRRPTCPSVRMDEETGKQAVCGREFKAVFDTARPLAFCPDPKCAKPIWGVRDDGSPGLREDGSPVLIMDRPDNHEISNYWTEADGPPHSVPDIRLASDFRVLEPAGRFEAVLTCRSERFSLVIPLGGETSRVEVYRQTDAGRRTLIGSRSMRLARGVRHRLEIVNVDAEFRAAVNGLLIGDKPYRYEPPEPGRSDAELRLSGGGRVALDNLTLDRDIYYGHVTRDMHQDWHRIPPERLKRSGIAIPGDSYFFLGDNQLASSDGRCFGPKHEDTIVARGLLVVWPPSRMHWIR